MYENNGGSITRAYRIITDDESAYSMQRKILFQGTERIPTVEDDVSSLLSKRYVAITQNVFIPISKIKKIIFIDESMEYY